MKTNKSFNLILDSYTKNISTKFSNKEFISKIYDLIIKSHNDTKDEDKDKILVHCALYEVLNSSSLTYDDIYSKIGSNEAEISETLSYKNINKRIEALLNSEYLVQSIELASRTIILENEKVDDNYKKECSLVLSCIKNCNLEISKKLEDIISS